MFAFRQTQYGEDGEDGEEGEDEVVQVVEVVVKLHQGGSGHADATQRQHQAEAAATDGGGREGQGSQREGGIKVNQPSSPKSTFPVRNL